MNKRNFSSDKEELLHTLARFDGNITVEDVTDSRSIKTHSKYHTFFLQVLLENVCRDIEPNEEKRERLFSEVCRRLSEAEFLNDSIVFDHLLPLRRKLAKQFFNFVKQIHHEVVPDSTQNNVTAESFLQDGDFSTKLDLQGRYEKNFEELEVIAQGGFGVVCKARYKVTDHVYAVKKVIFKYKSDSAYLKVIREAKNIAALSHSNIVSYNNAWIECMPPHESESDSSESSSGSEESDSENSEDQISPSFKDFGSFLGNENESPSFEICFSQNRSIEENTWQKTSSASISFLSENYSFNRNTSASSAKDSRTNSCSDDSTLSVSETGYQSKSETYNYVNKTSSWVNCFNVRLALYIQMEYCDCDLRLWLDRRAEGKELPFEMDVMKIFKDILYGLAYIHSKGIIHRDLKPRNIFFSKESSVLKIGDFGLATLINCTADNESGDVCSKHSANLGTVPYAAPEQIRYKTYDSKVDIYSLGIILIELLNKFSTEMELALAIKEIHRNNFPKDMEKTWPKHFPAFVIGKQLRPATQETDRVNLVKNLVKKEPEDRMSAKEILSQLNSLENLESNEDIIRVNEEMFKINEVLTAAVAEKDNEILQLKARIEELQNELFACKTQESGH